MTAGRSVEIFVDFDGTITDVDTFDVLVRRAGGELLWAEIERAFATRDMTLREALSIEAKAVALDRAAGIALWERTARVDPTFAPFVRSLQAVGANVTVLSAGIGSLIAHALERVGLGDLAIVANDVDYDPRGWNMVFTDDSPWGIYKERYVEAARDRGALTVYIGDGISDFIGAIEADMRFAKADRALADHLRSRGIEHTEFTTFEQIRALLLAALAEELSLFPNRPSLQDAF